MSYAIMRIQKIKTMPGLGEREKHNLREKTVFSADGSENILINGKKGLVSHVRALEEQVNKQNTRKTRKDAIKAIEIIFTSDKAFFKKVDYMQYFQNCKKWIADTFSNENILQSVIHLDEEIPHMHTILTTVKDGKFNYSAYINGRKDLRAMQDSFFATVQHLGLERGKKVELTGATYQHNKEWHKRIEKARTYAEALTEETQLDYAIKGIMATEQINKLVEENLELKTELKEVKENYNGLIVGACSLFKGDSQVKKANISRLQQQGKVALKRAKEKKARELEPIG